MDYNIGFTIKNQFPWKLQRRQNISKTVDIKKQMSFHLHKKKRHSERFQQINFKGNKGSIMYVIFLGKMSNTCTVVYKAKLDLVGSFTDVVSSDSDTTEIDAQGGKDVLSVERFLMMDIFSYNSIYLVDKRLLKSRFRKKSNSKFMIIIGNNCTYRKYDQSPYDNIVKALTHAREYTSSIGVIMTPHYYSGIESTCSEGYFDFFPRLEIQLLVSLEDDFSSYFFTHLSWSLLSLDIDFTEVHWRMQPIRILDKIIESKHLIVKNAWTLNTKLYTMKNVPQMFNSEVYNELEVTGSDRPAYVSPNGDIKDTMTEAKNDIDGRIERIVGGNDFPVNRDRSSDEDDEEDCLSGIMEDDYEVEDELESLSDDEITEVDIEDSPGYMAPLPQTGGVHFDVISLIGHWIPIYQDYSMEYINLCKVPISETSSLESSEIYAVPESSWNEDQFYENPGIVQVHSDIVRDHLDAGVDLVAIPESQY